MFLDVSAEEDSPRASRKAGANGFEAPTNFLQIGRDGRGCWVVRDRLGLKAGLFRSFESAHRFAKEEAAAQGLAIVAATEPLEFG
jgi:hypothetical protein